MGEYDRLRNSLLACRECGNEGAAHPMVQGRPDSKIMQISQAPSQVSVSRGELFDDASGRRLLSWYGIGRDAFLDPANFYITALSRCFPGKEDRGKDRPPSLRCARLWLLPELELVRNNLYVVIGSRAARFLFPDSSFEDLVFRDTVLNGRLAVVLPHPSPLNNRWFMKHPRFLAERLPEVRALIQRTLQL